MRRPPLHLLLLLALLAAPALAADAPPTQPATRPAIDPALLRQLTELDQRMGQIKDLTANFEQRKHTAMLRKPLVSSGTVKVRGPQARWDTQKPAPTVMLIGEHEVRMYYPQQKALEIYPLEQRLGQLAASPVPRLEVLRQYFAIERIPAESFADKDDNGHLLAMRLVPLEPALARHLKQVRVLVNLDTAVGVKLETIDADGEPTVIRFDNARVNHGLTDRDLDLQVPEGTSVSRPLAGMQNPSN